jgi:hypothetical protein
MSSRSSGFEDAVMDEIERIEFAAERQSVGFVRHEGWAYLSVSIHMAHVSRATLLLSHRRTIRQSAFRWLNRQLRPEARKMPWGHSLLPDRHSAKGEQSEEGGTYQFFLKKLGRPTERPPRTLLGLPVQNLTEAVSPNSRGVVELTVRYPELNAPLTVALDVALPSEMLVMRA